MYQVRLSIVGHADSDDRERAELGRELGSRIDGDRVADVSHPEAEAPDGAKGTALEWSQLVLGFVGSLPALIGYLRSWQSQGKQAGAEIALEIDGDRITLENPSDAEREQLVTAWLARHGPRD